MPDFLSNPNFDHLLQSGITRINCAAAAFQFRHRSVTRSQSKTGGRNRSANLDI